MAYLTICGLDEAGRGSLAGPVTAGCVVLGRDFPHHLVKDSKVLSEKDREELFSVIVEKATAWGLGWSWPVEIDRVNILQASLFAMHRAYQAMNVVCDQALIDGLFSPNLGIPCQAIVRGDACVPAISAASILAKVARDHWMVRWSCIDERYGFDKHKGYPTPSHKKAIAQHGLSIIHRASFRIKF